MRFATLRANRSSIRHIICCVLVAGSIGSSTQLQATQYQGLRLFHEPMLEDSSGSPFDQIHDQMHGQVHDQRQGISEYRQPVNRPTADDTVATPAMTKAPSASRANSDEDNSYQYNGFISTAFGQTYFINGLPLNTLNSLVLVSANSGGRSLELKTSRGQTFELSIGQSINKDSL